MDGQESRSGPIRLRVWGTNACFTRPEMKVERVSYDVMTQSRPGYSDGHPLETSN